MYIMKGIKIVVILAIVFITSCKEDKCKGGGAGGNLTIKATTVHHSRPIPGCTIYVKYNATEFPGEDVTKYDFSIKADNDKTFAFVSNLTCGEYYFYAVGIDSLLDPSNWICKGGITYSTSQEQDTIAISVPITEGD